MVSEYWIPTTNDDWFDFFVWTKAVQPCPDLNNNNSEIVSWIDSAVTSFSLFVTPKNTVRLIPHILLMVALKILVYL